MGEQSIYLVMEYAACGELFPLIFEVEVILTERERERRARHYFQQLVLGLQWCHKQGEHWSPRLDRGECAHGSRASREIQLAHALRARGPNPNAGV